MLYTVGEDEGVDSIWKIAEMNIGRQKPGQRITVQEVAAEVERILAINLDKIKSKTNSPDLIYKGLVLDLGGAPAPNKAVEKGREVPPEDLRAAESTEQPAQKPPDIQKAQVPGREQAAPVAAKALDYNSFSSAAAALQGAIAFEKSLERGPVERLQDLFTWDAAPTEASVRQDAIAAAKKAGVAPPLWALSRPADLSAQELESVLRAQELTRQLAPPPGGRISPTPHKESFSEIVRRIGERLSGVKIGLPTERLAERPKNLVEPKFTNRLGGRLQAPRNEPNPGPPRIR